MTSREERYRQETGLKRAVLDALTERVNRSPATPRVDTQHQPDCAEYLMNEKWQRVNIEHDDWQNVSASCLHDDWRDIRACGDNPSLPPDRFAHFYDTKTWTMYYVEHEYHPGSSLRTDTRPGDTAILADQSPGDDSTPALERSEVGTVLTRLVLMNGQFGPRGYSAWLPKQI